MLKEFKDFAMKGNVVDLAIGVIIGAAFGKIVTSMVEDIIMPIIGAITGGMSFDNMYTVLSGKVTAGAPLVDAVKTGSILAWGKFITISINFAIIAFVLFMIIKLVNKTKKAEAAAPPAAPPAQEVLLTEIRDLLKK